MATPAQLPANAQKRLAELREELAAGGAIYSTLSPGATLASISSGARPIGVVMGSTIYQVSFRARWLVLMGFARPDGEMRSYVQAQLELRRRAVDRLRQEAAVLGADGVIGVNLDLRTIPAGPVEFKLVGTAVRVEARPEDAPPGPFTSDLSAQDFQKLVASGGWPVDLVYGISVQYVRATWRTWWQNLSLRNREVTQVTEAMYTARRDAMQRMRAEARARGATGVVGADVWYEVLPIVRNNGWSTDYVVVYYARGTAISTRHVPPETKAGKPLMMLDLNSGSTTEITYED